LYWYNQEGKRYPTPQEWILQETQRAQQETQRAQQETQRAQKLADKLRELGIDPDTVV
jgi:hypothetical protein